MASSCNQIFSDRQQYFGIQAGVASQPDPARKVCSSRAQTSHQQILFQGLPCSLSHLTKQFFQRWDRGERFPVQSQLLCHTVI